jgi:ribosomal protein L12E/L44/L45/RPP1/RPP2
MKRISAILALAVLSSTFLLPNVAVAAPSAQSDARAARKANKKQQKAQKKYLKAQKKAQNKMIKKDRKNTHLPSHY